jgi:hypothetical protein
MKTANVLINIVGLADRQGGVVRRSLKCCGARAANRSGNAAPKQGDETVKDGRAFGSVHERRATFCHQISDR